MLSFLKYNQPTKHTHSPSCSSSSNQEIQKEEPDNAQLFLNFLFKIFMNIAKQDGCALEIIEEDLVDEVEFDFQDVILRVFQNLDCEPVCLLLGLLYFERYTKIIGELDIVQYEEDLLCCIVLSSKMLEDNYWSTKRYAEILEVEDYRCFLQTENRILKSLNFELYTSKETLELFIQSHR
eukprot:gene2253-2427_t